MNEPKRTPPDFDSVEVTFGGKTVTLPALCGSEGEVAIDISKLRAQTGLITLDPGFANTGSMIPRLDLPGQIARGR